MELNTRTFYLCDDAYNVMREISLGELKVGNIFVAKCDEELIEHETGLNVFKCTEEVTDDPVFGFGVTIEPVGKIDDWLI